ncbi:hypothetical protein P3T76_013357 [Phytophthora citrophthora]|uniref:Uncharacterized protein n=1 Tax=Phytophthora citrophthora TaxID=4793 RepID=A0AAD9G4A1_9STRA|nr:hypothetical protein P3T76_013357 [Phytophthora citrophthora]
MLSNGKSTRYTTLKRDQAKFKELKTALTKRGRPPEPDFNYCDAYHDEMGEFERSRRQHGEETCYFLSNESIRDLNRFWSIVEKNTCLKPIRQWVLWKRIKADLSVQHLLDNNRVAIPQKWESCRRRFDEVISEILDPKLRALYIYSREGQVGTLRCNFSHPDQLRAAHFQHCVAFMHSRYKCPPARARRNGRQPRSYTFCILTELMFENILAL